MRLKKRDIRKPEKPQPKPVKEIVHVESTAVDYTNFFVDQSLTIKKLSADIKNLCAVMPEERKFATYNFNINRNKDGLIESVMAQPVNAGN